jgi:hypothetical protein
VAPGRERVHARVARGEPRHPERHVLVQLDRAVLAVLRCQQHEALARRLLVEGLLVVARREPARVGHDPDLQEVDGLRLRSVLLAVRHAGAGAHELDLARPDHAAAARAVLVLEGALEHVRQDLHVAVPVGAEAGARLHAVVVDHAQAAKARLPGIEVLAERERVTAVEPTPVGAAAVLRLAFRDHGITLLVTTPPERRRPRAAARRCRGA